MTKRGGWGTSGFGERLRAVREAYGASQAELAGWVGVHLNTVQRIEAGEHEPAWPLALALAAALGCEITDFLPTSEE